MADDGLMFGSGVGGSGEGVLCLCAKGDVSMCHLWHACYRFAITGLSHLKETRMGEVTIYLQLGLDCRL